MTNEEALDWLINKISIDVTNSLEVPKDIECLEMCKKALEKQIPKPVNNRSHAWMYLGEWIYTGNCPNCGSILVSDIHPKGCPYCIRAIDWSEEYG